MATKAGVGKSLEPDAAEAGAQAAKIALEAGGGPAGLVLVASTMGYDQPALLAGVRSVTGDAPLVGCTGAGLIDEDGPDDALRRVEVMVIASDQITFTPVIAKGVNEDSEAVGRDLAAQLSKAWPANPKFLLLLSDGLKINHPWKRARSTRTWRCAFPCSWTRMTSRFILPVNGRRGRSY
jgi:hypothetical protein